MAAVPALLLLWMLTAHRQRGYGHWFAPQQCILSHIGGELPVGQQQFFIYVPTELSNLIQGPFCV